MVGLVVSLGLAFGFLNGVNDSGSLAAAMICSGAAGPRRALMLTAGAQLVGALTVGVAVARTIGQGIVDSRMISTRVVAAALIGAISWGIVSWYLGLPSSSSHALIGALVGAVWLQSGPGAIRLQGLGTVLLVLFLAPWVGFVVTFVLMRLLLLALRGATPRAGGYLRRMQWLLAPVVAAGHGANDSQKVMGVVALGLVSLGVLPSFSIPSWVKLAAALSLSAGTCVGGLRVMRTMGLRLYRIRSIHGFASLAATIVVVMTASLLGAPVSTTQIIGAGIAGAGSAERFSKVRWGVIGNIVVAWLLTIPAAGSLAAIVYWTLYRYV